MIGERGNEKDAAAIEKKKGEKGGGIGFLGGIRRVIRTANHIRKNRTPSR